MQKPDGSVYTVERTYIFNEDRELVFACADEDRDIPQSLGSRTYETLKQGGSTFYLVHDESGVLQLFKGLYDDDYYSCADFTALVEYGGRVYAVIWYSRVEGDTMDMLKETLKSVKFSGSGNLQAMDTSVGQMNYSAEQAEPLYGYDISVTADADGNQIRKKVVMNYGSEEETDYRLECVFYSNTQMKTVTDIYSALSYEEDRLDEYPVTLGRKNGTVTRAFFQRGNDLYQIHDCGKSIGAAFISGSTAESKKAFANLTCSLKFGDAAAEPATEAPTTEKPTEPDVTEPAYPDGPQDPGKRGAASIDELIGYLNSGSLFTYDQVRCCTVAGLLCQICDLNLAPDLSAVSLLDIEALTGQLTKAMQEEAEYESIRFNITGYEELDVKEYLSEWQGEEYCKEEYIDSVPPASAMESFFRSFMVNRYYAEQQAHDSINIPILQQFLWEFFNITQAWALKGTVDYTGMPGTGNEGWSSEIEETVMEFTVFKINGRYFLFMNEVW